MEFLYPHITKELRARYKVYVGKQITLRFYLLHILLWKKTTVKFGFRDL